MLFKTNITAITKNKVITKQHIIDNTFSRCNDHRNCKLQVFFTHCIQGADNSWSWCISCNFSQINYMLIFVSIIWIICKKKDNAILVYIECLNILTKTSVVVLHMFISKLLRSTITNPKSTFFLLPSCCIDVVLIFIISEALWLVRRYKMCVPRWREWEMRLHGWDVMHKKNETHERLNRPKKCHQNAT